MKPLPGGQAPQHDFGSRPFSGHRFRITKQGTYRACFRTSPSCRPEHEDSLVRPITAPWRRCPVFADTRQDTATGRLRYDAAEIVAMPNAGNGAKAVLRQIGSQYPRRVTLDGETIELRLMGDADVAAVLDFAARDASRRSVLPRRQLHRRIRGTGLGREHQGRQSDYGPRGQRRNGPR